MYEAFNAMIIRDARSYRVFRC